MTIVGAYLRVREPQIAAARQGLGAMAGVTTFDLDEPGTIGVLVEAATLDDAHAVVTRDLPAIDGVLGVWPVYVHDDEDEPQCGESCCRHVASA